VRHERNATHAKRGSKLPRTVVARSNILPRKRRPERLYAIANSTNSWRSNSQDSVGSDDSYPIKPTGSSRSRPRLGLVRGRGVSGAGVFLLVVAMFVAGCGGGSRPSVARVSRATANQNRENAYVEAAVRATRNLAGCAHLGESAVELSTGDRSTTSAPDGALLSVLAALHKPAVSPNSLPRAVVGWGHRREYGRFIRLAANVDGVAYYIIPTASPFRGWRLAPRCLTRLAAKAHADVRQLPVPMRAPTLALVARDIASDRVALGREVGEGVCLASSGNSGACGATAFDIRNWGLVAEYGRMVGLVPDGVTTVTVHLPASGKLPLPPTSQTGYRPASTATFGVVDNVFVTNISDVGQISGASITWRSANGKIIKTVPSQVAGVEIPAWS
jgi:hypothetical protein